jgi:choline dehydrogenase-like flavoprotein
VILDARNESVDLNLDTRVCIVGAGPAGLTLASELAGAGPVLLVESGGFGADATIDALSEGEHSGIDYPLTETRTRRFGGSSALWAGYCAQFDRHDFRHRAWVPRSGWPIDADVLAPFRNRAVATLNLGKDDFDALSTFADTGLDFPLAGDGIVPTIWRFGTPKQDFAARFAAVVAESREMLALVHANVVDLRLDKEHGRIDAVDVRTLDGREGRIEADIFVLACGGLETARLLLNADTQVGRGVGNSSGLVGRCFMEHPHLTLEALHLAGADAFRGWLERSSCADGRQFLGCVGLSPEAQAASGIMNARVHVFRTPQMSLEEIPRVGMFLEQAPNPDSRLTLLDDEDALGMRRLCLHWCITELEWHTFETTARILGDAFEQHGLGCMRSPGGPRVRDTSQILHSNHHLGTTRMSADPAAGVVDADCRMHDCENAFIIGGSVFPTVSWANPTFTLILLTLRLADHLKSILNKDAVQ